MPFFGKTGQKGQGEAADEKQSACDRLRKEKGGQKNSPMVRGIRP
jgi:hypothetical protein